jgi:hypothetical protein
MVQPAPAAAPLPAAPQKPLANQHILSAADEAMLRDFGSGSGLLELTREAYSVSPHLDVNNRPVELPISPPVGESDRQFQVVGTALTLANQLVQAHKAELVRSRRSGRFALILLASVVVVAAGLLGWGISNLGKVNLEQANANNLTRNYDTEIRRTAGEVESSKVQVSKMQADLAAAREQLAEAKAIATVLEANLKQANAGLAQINAELGAAKVQLSLAKARTAEAESNKPFPTTQSALAQ